MIRKILIKNFTVLLITTAILFNPIYAFGQSIITNYRAKPIIEPDIPSIYLKTGEIPENIQSEPLLRRFDLIFFISIPVTYYLILNFVQLSNNYFYGYGNALLGSSDESFIYISTIAVPLINVYFDYLYVKEEQSKRKSDPLEEENELKIFEWKWFN